jgi:siroheme synthase-like protein
MGYFPFFIDIENKSCVVVGGGIVALRKIEKLLPFKPQITVIAPKICDEILAISNIKICKKRFEISDLNSAFMAISATNDKNLNAQIFALCNDKGILINTVDDKEKCGFIFPALVKSDNLTVAISTSGKSPLYARFLREKIETTIDDSCDRVIETLNRYRDLVKREISLEKNRKIAFERILSLCADSAEGVDEEQIFRIIEDLK